MKVLLDLLAPPLLLFFAWSGARYWPSEDSTTEQVSAFLASALLGTLAGFRLAWSAFRWGRRRKGRDPERRPLAPDEVVVPMLRFMGCTVGGAICTGVGIALWGLAVAFFRSI